MGPKGECVPSGNCSYLAVHLRIYLVAKQQKTACRAFFILLLWLPGKEMEQKGKGFSTSLLRWTICLGLPPLVAWYGVRRRSLDHSGGMAAIVVGFVLTVASGCFCVSLLVFFFTSSRLTRWRGKEKEKFEEDHKKGVELRSVYHCMQMCTVLAD